VYYSDKEKIMKAMLIANCSKFKVFKDNIFIASTERGFYIAVYNNNGKLLYEIRKDYKKRAITVEEKDSILDNLRKSIGEAEWAKRKSMVIYEFPQYSPAFCNFSVKDDKIYILQFPLESQLEILIIDLKGNFLKKKIIPYKMRAGDIEFGRYDISDGKIYYMVENEATDGWELQIEDIE
jgi:hypothetical protein